MKIGILQTGRSPDDLLEEHGDYAQMFPRLLDGYGFTFEIYPVLDDEFPSDIHAADGWLITGSRFGAYEKHDWITRLEDFLRQAYAGAVPIIGVCFGHQILAQALGGRVEKFKGGWSVGRVNYTMENSTAPVPLMAWHQDQVVEKPADATVIGSSPFCEFAMLAYGDKALSVQPHPEFNSAFVDGLIRVRGPGAVPPDRLSAASQMLDESLATKEIADQFAAFFKYSAQKKPPQ